MYKQWVKGYMNYDYALLFRLLDTPKLSCHNLQSPHFTEGWSIRKERPPVPLISSALEQKMEHKSTKMVRNRTQDQGMEKKEHCS